jgi:general secretion pathway protein L
MRTLIVQLPLGPPSPGTAYPHALVQTLSATPAPALQWAAASLLPVPDRQTEVAVLLPALAMSWHQVELPAGLHKQPAKLKAALEGILEERVLDDTADLHMSLAPDWKDSARPWVAICHRQWLSEHLQALEAAGLTVNRIVPELAPTSTILQLQALGTTEQGWLWCSQTERGVWGLPLQAVPLNGAGLWAADEERTQADIQAEPAMVAATSQRLGLQARLVAPNQHWLAALASDWDLAQFDFQANARTRRVKNWQRTANHLWQHNTWRPARWALAVLLASQLLGLNAWAWKTRTDWQIQQQAWTQMLLDTFPQTRVVVDAPLQMAKEVARLRQGSGQLAAHDLESMLATLGQALPAGVAAPRQWRYQTGQLQLQNFELSASQQETMRQSLNAQGYQWRADGQTVIMSLLESSK